MRTILDFETNPVLLSSADPHFDVRLKALLHGSLDPDQNIENAVAAIVADVKLRGDAALLEYTQRFDKLKAPTVAALELTQDEFKAAFDEVTDEQREALQAAADRIRSYHQAQKKACGESWSYHDEHGNLLGQRVTPLDRVGIYVPGGKAAYPSSVLMNAVPAHVAGVQEIIMMVPTPGGFKNKLVLAAAYVAGITRAFTLGGAQAIAALAYGTETIPGVDKITGPGNAYVTAAKRRLFGTVGIDMVAGPSEILVLADGTIPVDWVVMDMFSQAEHDELAQSILISPSKTYLENAQYAMYRMLPLLDRADIVADSINSRGAFIHARSMEEACEISNRIAPEHLEIASMKPHQWDHLLKHAGAVFYGGFTSEALGDYCAGPSHVLPTSGTARFSSALGVYDFQKRSSLIEVSKDGAQVLGIAAKTLAYGEGLQAHALSAGMRMKSSWADPFKKKK